MIVEITYELILCFTLTVGKLSLHELHTSCTQFYELAMTQFILHQMVHI